MRIRDAFDPFLRISLILLTATGLNIMQQLGHKLCHIIRRTSSEQAHRIDSLIEPPSPR